MPIPNIAVGDKVVVTTDRWFIGPDGRQYSAAYGTVKGVHSDADTLGIRTNARSTNWYLEIRRMVIAGCQVHYAVKAQDVNLGESEGWAFESGQFHRYTNPSRIYNADGEG